MPGVRILALAAAAQAPAEPAGETSWPGPGRFCGYATVIDLTAGESIVPSSAAVHSATFEWTGKFGAVSVREINWAARPPGATILIDHLDQPQVMRISGSVRRAEYALWDGKHLAAYVAGPALASELGAAGILRRIELVDHAGKVKAGCKYRMFFGWD